jgi:phosphoribosyl 1,2-cyclic phosphate phosphodiesterase
MKLTILGSGTSHGVPMLGCGCPVCKSTDSRDRRLRSSLYVQGSRGEGVVIDTGPEFRLQALRAGIRRLDAVLLTHSHADHIHGADDLRPLSREAPLPIYGNGETIGEFRERFSYVFKETQRGGGKPQLRPVVVSGPFAVGGLLFSPLPVLHGALPILGWRIDETARDGADSGNGADNGDGKGAGSNAAAPGSRSAVYLTDTSEIPGPSWPLIGSPEVLIIGGLRVRPHSTHFSFGEALEAAAKTEARRSFLTHICHDSCQREIEEYCRNYQEEHKLEGLYMGPAYDGLELAV